MTDSLMGVVQAALRAATGTTQTYQGDWHAYADAQGISSGSWEGRVLALAQAIDPTITTAAAAHNYFLLNPTSIGVTTADIGALQG